MARTYGQSTSLGTTNAQSPSPMPPGREKMLKALRSPRRKVPLYTAQPSITPVGPVPPPTPTRMTPPGVDPQYAQLPPLDAAAPANIGVQPFDVASADVPTNVPGIAPPGYEPNIARHLSGISYADDPETQDVEIGGKVYKVPRQFVGPPPPSLQNPGPAPIISEPGLQRARNQGGQNAGLIGALASLFGGDSGYIGENLPSITSQGIAGGEQGALDRYGREVNNYNATAGSMQLENNNALTDYQNQTAYAGELNRAQNAPTEAAIRQIEIENAAKRLQQADARLELTKRGFDLRETTRGYGAFQKFDKVFREAPPALRSEMLSDDYLRQYGISPTTASIYRDLVDKDLTNPAEKQKLGKAIIGDVFGQLKNNLLSSDDKEKLFASLPELAKSYGLDLGSLPKVVNFNDISPADQVRFDIAMAEHYSKDEYRKGILEIQGDRIKVDKAKLSLEKMRELRIAYNQDTDPEHRTRLVTAISNALIATPATITYKDENGDTQTRPNPTYNALVEAQARAVAGDFGAGYKQDFSSWMESSYAKSVNRAGGNTAIPQAKDGPLTLPGTPPGQPPLSPNGSRLTPPFDPNYGLFGIGTGEPDTIAPPGASYSPPPQKRLAPSVPGRKAAPKKAPPKDTTPAKVKAGISVLRAQ